MGWPVAAEARGVRTGVGKEAVMVDAVGDVEVDMVGGGKKWC